MCVKLEKRRESGTHTHAHTHTAKNFSKMIFVEVFLPSARDSLAARGGKGCCFARVLES